MNCVINYNKNKLVNVIISNYYTGGRSRIDLGLDEATIVLFNQRYNPNGNKKYLFVITDGRQTRLHSHRYPNLKERTW